MNKIDFVKKGLEKEFSDLDFFEINEEFEIDEYVKNISRADSEELILHLFDLDSHLLFSVEDPKSNDIDSGRSYFASNFEMSIIYPKTSFYFSCEGVVDDLKVQACVNLKENMLGFMAPTSIDINDIVSTLTTIMEEYMKKPALVVENPLTSTCKAYTPNPELFGTTEEGIEKEIIFTPKKTTSLFKF